MRSRVARPWAVLFLCALPGFAQERALTLLTLDEALALARQRAGGVVLARGRLEEARALETRAGRRLQENPELEVAAGSRRAGDEGFLDFETALSQGLDSGVRRAARLAEARSAVERAEAELAEAERRLLREAWTGFVRALLAGERQDLLARNRQVADGLLALTERRYEEGEATALELNRARVAAASARAGQSAAEAGAAARRSELGAVLGLTPAETVELRPGSALPPPPELAPLLAGLAGRPDLRVLEAELRQAEAGVLLGEARRRPGLGVRGGLAREEGAEIVTAGVVVSLPVHDQGREAVAAAQARAASLRQAIAAARAAAELEVRGLHRALSGQLAATGELERTALPALEDNESLALKSFEAGEIDLGELLLVRREILETRLSHLDRRLEAALTRVELEAAAGALR